MCPYIHCDAWHMETIRFLGKKITRLPGLWRRYHLWLSLKHCKKIDIMHFRKHFCGSNQHHFRIDSGNDSTLVQVMAWCRQPTKHHLKPVMAWFGVVNKFGVVRLETPSQVIWLLFYNTRINIHCYWLPVIHIVYSLTSLMIPFTYQIQICQNNRYFADDIY